jgi:hypothetical protein
MNDSGADFGVGMGAGITICLGAALMFTFGFVVGEQNGKVEGEKQTALITVQALNKIKQHTKITNPFTAQQLNTLSYSAQDILKLF